MAAVAPVLTLTQVGGFLITRWTSTDQVEAKIAIYRGGSRGQRPDYGTVRYRGQSLQATGAHLIPAINLSRLRWDGNVPTSGRLSNGTYEVRIYYINEDGERSATVSGTITISGVGGGASRERYPLDPAMFTSPTFNQVFNNTNVVVSWNAITGQAGYKVSIYRDDDVDDNYEPYPGVSPVYGTIRPGLRNDPVRSHWAVGSANSVTFSDTSSNANAQIADGNWVARMRWRNSVGEQSKVVVAPFSVTSVKVFEEPDPETIGAPPQGQGLGVHWLTDQMNARVDRDLVLDWNAVFQSGLDQKSFRIRRNLSAGPMSGDSYLRLPDSGGIEWTATATSVNDIESALTRIAASRQGSTANPATDWGDPTWGTHQFFVTATDTDDTISSESSALTVLPYKTFNIINAVTSGADVQPALNATQANQNTNNWMVDYKIAVYASELVVAGQPLPPPSFGTVRFLDQPLDAPGAHWTPMPPYTSAPLGVGEPIQALLVEFQANEERISLNETLQAGTWTIRLKGRDRFGNETNTLQVDSFTHNPPAPRTRQPYLYVVQEFDHPTVRISGQPANYGLTLATPTTGLIPGIAIGIYATQIGTLQQAEGNRIIIERREFEREDGTPPDRTPVRLPINIDDRELAYGAPTIWNSALQSVPLGTGVAYWWFDRTPESGVQYEYRIITSLLASGGRAISAWYPT